MCICRFAQYSVFIHVEVLYSCQDTNDKQADGLLARLQAD